MKAVRLVLHQRSAHYRKEETVDNRMTYPLPPISTVIGAIHNACGYREYHPMKISIQGNYESMNQEVYTDYTFLNSTMDDRGILVKMKNEDLLSNAFEKVASAKKSQGNSFRKNITIQVQNQKLLEEFQNLKELNDKIQDFKKTRITPILDLIKKRKTTLVKKKKIFTKNSEEYVKVCDREKEIKALEKEIKERLKVYETEFYTKPVSKFRSLTTGPRYYEVLNEVTLILHIQADDFVMEDILEHQYDLVSIGRSEDFVSLIDARMVELEEYDGEDDITSDYSAYLDIGLVRDRTILTKAEKELSGTKYYLNRDYEIIDKKRVFHKKVVLYASNYVICETDSSMGLYVDQNKIDELGDQGIYIVNLL